MSQSRRLAAIMFTDIVGYTALMGDDEKKAFEVLRKSREIQQPLIKQFSGKWIKEIGDGVLASFDTVTDAVLCASTIQQACMHISGLKLRIGIHQGEVVFEGDDVFGDGVNIASRIQAIATPGAIYISGSVQNNISNKKEIATRFVKEENLKNVKEAVKIYEVLPKNVQPLSSDSSIIHPEANGNSEKSIAVLPFVNMSNDPEQEYFCDGISEEIINALAQLNNLRVIARTSAFSFKGKNLDVREIGKTLDVNTLLEGSVRKAGNHLRITTKLVRVSDGSHLWVNRYDRVLEDVFAIQEDIAENVAMALKGVLTNKEKEAIRRPETNIEAYEYYLRGRRLFHQLALKESKIFFEKAIELDPQYALAYAGLADAHSWLYEWEGSDKTDLEAAERNSQKALALAPTLSESHSSRGFVLSLGNRYDEAEQEFKEAIRLNSNNFDAYYYYGRACFARGKIEESADMLLKASEVRREDFQSKLILAQSLQILGKPETRETMLEGISRARKQLKLDPTDRRALSLTAGNLWQVGKKEEALQWINKALDLYPEDAGVLINAACLFARNGYKEKAMNFLEKAFGKGFGKKEWIERDPDFNSLRKEPRFKALLSKLK
jgi:adenylate cyclase